MLDLSKYTLISNTCVGGFLYQELHRIYDNPFMWSMLNEEDVLTLINDFNRINFSKYELISCYSSESTGRLNRAFGHKEREIYGIRVDKKLDIWYPHCIKDENCIEPVIKDNNIYRNDIEEYVLDRYRLRRKRMQKPPLFIIEAGGAEYTYDKDKSVNLEGFYTDLVNLNDNYKKILIVYKDTLNVDWVENENISTIYLPKPLPAKEKAKAVLESIA